MKKKQDPASLADAWNSIRNDYDMSRDNRFVRKRTGLPYNGAAADWHYRSEAHYYQDIEKARDMDRNDAIVGQTVDRAVTNIVQEGFTLDPKTGDSALDRDIKARWLDWSSDPDQCDIAGEFCFTDFEAHSMRSAFLDGDCVNLGLSSGHLQHIEAHSIQTTTRIEDTILGVTRDSLGKRLRYYVMADPIDPRSNLKEQAKPVDVRNEQGLRTLFHVMNPKRMSQTRGVTAFAPIFSLTGMFEDINFAKLVQQQVVSCFAIFRQQQYLPNLPGTSTDDGYGNGTTEQTDSGGTRYIENIAPGMEIVGRPGEQLQGFSPSVPNAEYFEHVKLMLQMIGVNLGLPLCLVLMDGSETNFSGWRGAVDEARKGWKRNQRSLVKRFHAPVYRWKMTQWLAEDPALREAARRANIFAHAWNPPSWPYIEPKKDAEGDALQLQNALISPRRKHSERGRDWQEIATEIVEDNAFAISLAMKAAKQINEENQAIDQPVLWRELINLPMPSGMKVNVSKSESETEQSDGEV